MEIEKKIKEKFEQIKDYFVEKCNDVDFEIGSEKDGTYTTEVTDTFNSTWVEFDISDMIGIKMMAKQSIGIFYSLE